MTGIGCWGLLVSIPLVLVAVPAGLVAAAIGVAFLIKGVRKHTDWVKKHPELFGPASLEAASVEQAVWVEIPGLYEIDCVIRNAQYSEAFRIANNIERGSS